jgi:hypothetical protein
MSFLFLSLGLTASPICVSRGLKSASAEIAHRVLRRGDVVCVCVSVSRAPEVRDCSLLPADLAACAWPVLAAVLGSLFSCFG